MMEEEAVKKALPSALFNKLQQKRQLEEVAMPVMTIPVCKCEVRGINLLKRSCLPFAAQQTLYSFH